MSTTRYHRRTCQQDDEKRKSSVLVAFKKPTTPSKSPATCRPWRARREQLSAKWRRRDLRHSKGGERTDERSYGAGGSGNSVRENGCRRPQPRSPATRCSTPDSTAALLGSTTHLLTLLQGVERIGNGLLGCLSSVQNGLTSGV